MAVKAKRFRIGVEGATTDGREISREWLVQMAAAYNPAVYTATINLEHIKSYSPDSTFNRYGTVSALGTEEITDGPLAGKLALYADILPTDSLVALVKQGQKLFTSMEVSTKFADTGKAYLVGLAATDDPASLGTEMLAFSASAQHNPLANRKQHPENLFTAATETEIELEEVEDSRLAAEMDDANRAMAPLQDAVDISIATDEETARLTQWKKYRVMLSRIDVSAAPDISWPVKPA